jgi:hypothetical protein
MRCGRYVHVSHRLVRDETGRGVGARPIRDYRRAARLTVRRRAELNELGPSSLLQWSAWTQPQVLRPAPCS